jgi:hypothetical protein
VIPVPAVERRRRLPRFPLQWALPPLVLVLHIALGYWIVTTLTAPTPRATEAPAPAIPRTTGTQLYTAATQATGSPARFSRITGFEVVRVAVSGGGGIVDLRYRVLDEGKAASHVRHQSLPAIIDAQTGTPLTKQWMGHAHAPVSFRDDRNYWMLFLNQSELVKRGERVAVRLGHARLTGIRVR